MSVPWSAGDTIRRTLAEAVGAFLLVLIGPGAMMMEHQTGLISHFGVAAAFGAVVSVAVYAFGPVSGAHINPAVTVALWSVGRFPTRAVVPYVAAQCVGAAVAAGLLVIGTGTSARYGATLPSVTVPVAFGVEAVLSAVLMLAVLAALSDRGARLTAPIQLGLTVGFCALVGGPLTGASMNPARSFGPALVSGAWEAHWLYWSAPILAMVVVGRLAGVGRVRLGAEKA